MSIFKLDAATAKNRVNVHHDFEFVDDGLKGLFFISIGAVIEGPKAKKLFYGINESFFKSERFIAMCAENNKQNDWMFENVFSHIQANMLGRELQEVMSLSEGRRFIAKRGAKSFEIRQRDQRTLSKPTPTIIVGTTEQIKNKLVETIESTIDSKSYEIQPWGYYTAHDHVLLSNLFGNMSNMPDNWIYYSYDIRQMTDIFGLDHDDWNPNTPHHPLYDAIAQYKMAKRIQDHIAKIDATELGKAVKG